MRAETIWRCLLLSRYVETLRKEHCGHLDDSVKAIVKSMPDEMTDDLPNEETNSPDFADQQNFYKVEKWTKDGIKVDRMLYAGSNLDIHRSHQAPATYPPDNQAADWSVAAVAAAMKSPGRGRLAGVSVQHCCVHCETLIFRPQARRPVKSTPP